MGLMKTSDGAVLAGLCQNWSFFVRTSRMLNGLEGLDSAEHVMGARRLVSMNSEAFKNYARACAEFGLTPSSRTRVVVEDEAGQEDEFDAFLKRKPRPGTKVVEGKT